MNSRISTRITAMTLCSVLAIPIRLAAQEQQPNKQQPRYKLIDLGTFGGSASFINPPFNVVPALNNQGLTVGSSATSISTTSTSNGFVCGGLDGLVPKVFHAFEWQSGVVADLGALPPSRENCSNAGSISASGEIAGSSENGQVDPFFPINDLRAVLWKDGQISDLGTLGGTISVATGIDSHGQVVGGAQNTVLDPFSMLYFVLLGLSTGTHSSVRFSGRTG